MKTISSIEDLADLMFDVHQACTLSEPDFCASMVSCAVTTATRDGLDNKAVFDLILKAATSALVSVRTSEKLRDAGYDAGAMEVH
jgi:hypothetical protein